MENEDVLYGYSGKRIDCKTRACPPFFMNSFCKCMIELKNIRSYKIFLKTCLRQYLFLLCLPDKSLWNFRIPELNIFSR